MKKFVIIAVILFNYFIGFTQNKNRTFKKMELQGTQVFIEVSDGFYNINLLSPQMLETTFVPSKEVILPGTHAVVVNREAYDFQVTERAEDILLKYKDLYVTITKSPFQISYYYKDQLITSEKRGYYKSVHQPMDMVKGNIVADSTEKIEFNLTKDEVLYGGGARALGMNRRGNRLPLFNRAHYGYETESKLMNFTLPIVLSSNKYMIHFDNEPIGYLDLDSKQDNTLTYEAISGRKTYQVIVGDTWYDIMDSYTDLTGKQPMVPRWALGNFSSRFGYHSQQETIETIDKFREEEIPVDAIILDLYWFGKDIKGTMGNLEFLKDSFPDPKKMIKNLASKNVETILITEPFILTTSKKWDEAVEKDILAKDSLGNPAKYDFYFGNTGIVDIYNPKGEQWFKNIYKGLSDIGVNGFWGDLGEPEVHPNWVQHHTGSAAEVHNIYGHDWAKLVYEASLEANPDKRPFILMRAGYSGSQRYGLIPWSGDVNRTWGGLQSQPEIALQMGMQGLGYMHSDLGGFAGANLDDELYTRWLQYGVFQPIYRPHAQEDVPSEPVFREEKTKQFAKESIELRYKMLPYNYNLAFENNQDGTPLMRPLFFEDDSAYLTVNSSTYFWGNDFLITPILKSGVKEKEVYFPKNNVWFDFYSDVKIEGGQTISIQTKDNSIPTHIRAGAFIPMAKLVQSTDDYSLKDFDLHYYYDTSVKENARKFYNDDGLTNSAFENEQYEILEFKFEQEKRCVEFEFEAETGSNYALEKKNINLIIHGLNKFPRRVKINGKRSMFYLENYGKNIVIPVTWNISEEIEIKIKLKK